MVYEDGEMLGLKALLQRLGAQDLERERILAVVDAVAQGIRAYEEDSLGTKESRFLNAVNVAARHFLLTAASHELLPDNS